MSARANRSTSDGRGTQQATPPPRSNQLISVNELQRFDEVVPLVDAALRDLRIEERTQPDVIQTRILESLDKTKVELVSQMSELNRILTEGILALQRNRSLGSDTEKDLILREVMGGFVAAIRERSDQLQESSQSFGVIRKRAEALEKESKELRASTATVEQRATQLESDKEELTRQLKDKDSELERVSRENDTLQSNEEGRERDILRQSKREQDTLKLKFESQLNDLEERLRSSKADNAKKESESRSSEQDARRLVRERDAALKTIEDLVKQKKRAEEDVAIAQRDAKSEARDNLELNKRVKQLEDALETAENSAESLQGRIDDLTLSVKNDDDKIVRESVQASVLTKQVKSLTNELRELESQCSKTSAENDELQATLRDRDRELSRLRQDDAQEKQDIARLRRENEQREELLAKTTDKLEDAREESRERARKPTPTPKKGEQWEYRQETLDTCAIGLKECPHPNRKVIKKSEYTSNTAPPSIALVIDTFNQEERKAIEVTALTIGFRDGTEKKGESPVAFTFTPSDKKPILDTEIKVNIIPAGKNERTSIRFVGFDIDLKLDRATFDPLFLQDKGQAPVISVVLKDKDRKVHRDSVALTISRWDTTTTAAATDTRAGATTSGGDTVREPPKEVEEEIPVARETPDGSISIGKRTDTLRVGSDKLNFETSVPTFPNEPTRILDELFLALSEQSSPKRLLTVCSTEEEGVNLLDSTLFTLSRSGQQGLTQGTVVKVNVFPYSSRVGSQSTDNATIVEYQPDEGTFDARTDRELTINVYLCKKSNVSRFDSTKSNYIFTLSGQSSDPVAKKVFVEKVEARTSGATKQRVRADTTVRGETTKQRASTTVRREVPRRNIASVSGRRRGQSSIGMSYEDEEDVFEMNL